MEVTLMLILLQSAGLVFAACFLGYILADRLGLVRSFRIEKKKLRITLILTIISGIIFALDYWTFGAVEPLIENAVVSGLTVYGVTASILYGGIIEEILLRWLMLSLIAYLIWKVAFRKKESAPAAALIAANIIAALLFAAGHIPATITLFGDLTSLLLFRCFLLNGGFGLLFGWLYYSYGIQYAMISHAGLHIVSKLIWVMFI